MSSERLLIKEAKKDRDLKNLAKYLRIISETIKKDPEARAYLFGSVAEGKTYYQAI